MKGSQDECYRCTFKHVNRFGLEVEYQEGCIGLGLPRQPPVPEHLKELPHWKD
jgi:hypothetical protein